MNSTSLIRTIFFLTAGIAASGSLLANPRSSEASELLRQVKSNAIHLTREAAVYQSYAHGGISRESHYLRANLVRDHINTMGKQLTRLQEIRHESAPWQRQAIDDVVPMAADLAAETEAAIQHLNDGSKPLWLPSYTDRLHAIFDQSDQVKDAVNLHLDMAETEEKMEQLRERASMLGT